MTISLIKITFNDTVNGPNEKDKYRNQYLSWVTDDASLIIAIAPL